MDATAYLLERSGDLLGAFKLIREVSRNPAAILCDVCSCDCCSTGAYSLRCVRPTSTYHCLLHATFGVDE